MPTILAVFIACGPEETGATFVGAGGTTAPEAPEGGGGSTEETGGTTVPFDTGRFPARPPPGTAEPER